ncbi:hypothetical protein [uncultured Clostridium sp.]|uniref:hypothetical protein n=1 Tax=uncultured Clostridium sp. TaxID=59620 RepID=UPI0026F0F00C|nr:hypothetical protein [uncultured Clostridium sp.]
MADNKSEYYILTCPYCDKNITKVMENITGNTVVCPSCQKELNLYTVFGYNMWLVEKGNFKKVTKKPIKTIKNQVEVENFVLDEDYIDDELEEINFDSISDNSPTNLQILLSQNADICTTQYNYLIKKGFTRLEAIDIVLKLIEHGFIL